jgi:hypothetical protein
MRFVTSVLAQRFVTSALAQRNRAIARAAGDLNRCSYRKNG